MMIRIVGLALLLVLAACGGTNASDSTTSTAPGISSTTPATSTTTTSSVASIASSSVCADVVDVKMTVEEGGSYRFDVTVRSADTGWEKYADAWEVRAPDGTVLGTRVLAHPHVDEQPFTRSLTGVAVRDDIDEVTVAARDLVEGFCGETRTLPLP
jgi:hypothetical protein